MRFKHHPGYPPPSPDVIASVAAVLSGKELTDSCQFEHDVRFSFGEIVLNAEGPWRLLDRDGAIMINDDARQLVDDPQQARVNAVLEHCLHGRVVADVTVSELGDLAIQFLRGERLAISTIPTGTQAWILEVGEKIFVAEWGGLLEKEPKAVPDKDGIWRILRGG